MSNKEIYIRGQKLCQYIKKVLRYNRLYGFKRTLVKIAGRTRKKYLRTLFWKKVMKKEISLIGCGQFGFSTISFYLNKKLGNRFLECYDIDKYAAKTTADFWGYKAVQNVDELIKNPDCKYVYIASDHFSHSKYAISALKAGKIVYCEKPISVTKEQLYDLINTVMEYGGEIYFGYNRPFSKAIRQLTKRILKCNGAITLSCFITAEKLEAEHWYNNPKEGTRICGNLGHWIDLSLYLFSVRSESGDIPNEYSINICYGDENVIDDNIVVSYSTEFGDVVTLTMTSRAKPFEGINESINFQCNDVIAKIDDFRSMTIWENERINHYRYFYKDAGHECAVCQPFTTEKRNSKVIFYSSLLMLWIKEMAAGHEKSGFYKFNENNAKITKILK